MAIMSKEKKLSEKFMIFVGRCNGASLVKFDIAKFNDEASIIANGIDKYEKQLAELKAILNADNKMNKNVLKLAEENKQLKAENKKVKKLLDKYCYLDIEELEDVFKSNLNQVAILSYENVNLKNDISIKRGEILDLQQQLKEKDEEIEDLKAKLKSVELCFNITNSPTKEEMIKRITKQVCEKIRNWCYEDENMNQIEKDYDSSVGGVETYKLEQFLDQLEKELDNE